MTIARLLSNNQLDVSQPALSRPTNLSNTWYAGVYSSFLDIKGSYDYDPERVKLEGETVNKLKEKTGVQNLSQIIKIDEGKYNSPLKPFRDAREKAVRQATDNFIIEQRKIDPSFNDVKTYGEIRNDRDIKLKQEALFAREFIGEQAAGEGLTGSATLLGAGMLGSFADPINAATMFVGVGTAKNILQFVGREAALNAGIEAVQTPKRAEWEKKLGQEYGLKQAVSDIALAGAAGGAFAGVVGGAVKGAEFVEKKYFAKRQAETMQVMDAISRNPNVPMEARDAAKYLSRSSHIEEGNPVTGGVLKDNIQHKRNMLETERAFVEGRSPDVKIDAPMVDPYIVKARDIKETLKGVRYADINEPQQLKKILGYTPRSLSQFVKETGGIQDIGGELSNKDIDLPFLIRKGNAKKGTSQGIVTIDNQPERVIERAFDAGYFPNKESANDITEDELLDALRRDVRGEKIYSSKDISAIEGATGGSRIADQYDEIGIDADMTDEEIASVLREFDAKKLPEQDLIFTPKDSSITLEEFAKVYDDPNYQAAIEADYMRMLDEQGEIDIEIDGETMTLSRFNDMLMDDENVLNAVKVCAIG